MYVSLGIFTQYRRELMGVATVLILLCHSLLPPAIHCPNDILRWIIITGNRGVDIFLFLSGLGMYHSLRKMTKWNRGGVIRWYAKRYRHILLPYLLICFPYYLVLGCVNDGHFSISIFLYRLSTLNYWLEHKGFWYIAMLIPLYFLTPFYARIIDKTKYQTLLTVTLCIILLLISTIKIENINQKEKGTLAIVNCCEHEFSIATATTAGANPLNPIQQYYNIQEARTKADYVLVIVHGGHEHYALPSPRMKETYRFFIDAGADAIINHHQHCYSGYEIYHGKPIFYGLGNLLFDHKSERHGPWNEGFMVSLRLDKQTLPQFELYPYTQCNERPSVIPMNEAERKIFAERIDKLNQIISNEDQLNTTFETWAQKTSRNFLVPFQPYCTRTAKRLFVHGLLPSFITRKKRYQILNYLNCEAHLDKLRTVVSKLK